MEPSATPLEADVGSASRPSGRRGPRDVAIGVLLFFLAFSPPIAYSVDENSMLAVAESLLLRGSVSVPPSLGSPGADKRYYSRWYPLNSFLAVPFMGVGHVVAPALHLPPHYVRNAAAMLLPICFTAATIYFLILLTLRLGASHRHAYLAALGYIFGTYVLTFTRTFFPEPEIAFLVVLGIYVSVVGTRWALVGAAIVSALAVLSKPPMGLEGTVLSGYLLLKKQSWTRAALPLLGAFAGLGFYLLYNQARWGDPFVFSYVGRFFVPSYFPEGVARQLVSPRVGLLWFCPAAFLGLFVGFTLLRTRRADALLVLGLFAALLGFYGLWNNQGWDWGPRYLLPALPGLFILIALALPRLKRTYFALLAVGLLVNAPTLVSFYERHYAEVHEQNREVKDWSWSDAPFLNAWPAAARQVRDAMGADPAALVEHSAQGVRGYTIATSQGLRIVPVWWWLLPAARIPRATGAGLAVLLVALGAYLVLRAFSEAVVPGLQG